MPKIFELRHYQPIAGKVEVFTNRFKAVVLPLMDKYQFKIDSFWEDAGGNGELWYIIEWSDEFTMQREWSRFREDPEWIAAKAATEVDGPLVARSTSTVLRQPLFLRHGRLS